MAQVKNVSTVEWQRLMSAYHQAPGLDPAASRPPPWEPVSPKLPPSSTTPAMGWGHPTQWDCLAPCRAGTKASARQSAGALPYDSDPGPHTGLSDFREGPRTHCPADTERHGDLDPRCFQVSRMVVLEDVPREARQPYGSVVLWLHGLART